MKKNSNDRSQRHGILARVQPTKQILFHAVVRSRFHRCGGAGTLLVLLCLFFSAARVLAQTYALGTATSLEGPAAGTDSVVLAVTPATQAWTATANASWLHLDTADQSGTGNTNVVFTFDTNPGATRTGTLTVAGQTLTVTQAGSTYVAANPITTLISWVPGPRNMAVDGAGNIYFPDDYNNAVQKWTAANNTVATLVSSGLTGPECVVLDSAGNVYIADYWGNAIRKWTAANNTVTTLVSTGLNNPYSVALDSAGNVYIADSGNNAIKKWSAATHTVTTLVSSGLSLPVSVAVDRAGNVYIADSWNNAFKELPRAFVDTAAMTEGADAGSDVLPSVLPASENLLAPFAPTSSQSWLTISGTANGVVSFAFTDNSGPSRTAQITVLGVNIAITQAGLFTAALGTNALTGAAPAGSDSVVLTVSLPTGPWTAEANAYWLHLSAANQSGVGSTNVDFTFDANQGAPRTGTLTIAGQTLTVTQFGNSSLGTATLVEGPSAGADSVVLAMFGPIAAWTATANASWLHLDAADQNGTGSTNVVFTFDTNPGATRTGTLTVAGLNLTVTQAGSTYVAANPITTLVSSGLNSPQIMAADGAGNVYFADADNNAIKKWTAASNTVTTLVSAGLNGPGGVAVDGAGNVYIADFGNDSIKKWTAASGTVTTLVSSGLNGPNAVALDSAGDVYIADSYNNAVKEWTAANNTVTTLVSSGLNTPYGVAVDGAGNVFIADSYNNAIKEWTAANNTVTTLVSSGLNQPNTVAVDGAGNVFIADSGNNAIKKWTAANKTVTTLVSSGLNTPYGVAVDNAGNVYIADSGNNAIKELPRAFVDPTAMTEGAGAGSDVLPSVLPASENLLAPFAPASSPPWLTIGGAASGMVSFYFTANNTGTVRVAQITVLGRSITINQTAATAPVMGAPVRMPDGSFQLNFTGTAGASYSVLFSTNLALPLGAWTVVGTATNTSGDQFQFTAPPSPGTPAGFFLLRSP
jgi:DNA-binding beta-propeller fold protein YncE